MASPAPPEHYRFGTFELQPDNRRLLKDGATIALRPRAFDLLAALVDRAGHLVTKDELLDRVWPKMVVEEAALHVQVSALRKLIGADAITTVSGRGYQFTLPVTKGNGDANGVSSPERCVCRWYAGRARRSRRTSRHQGRIARPRVAEDGGRGSRVARATTCPIS